MIRFQPSRRMPSARSESWLTPALLRLVQLWCAELVLDCQAYSAREQGDFEEFNDSIWKCAGLEPMRAPESMPELIEALSHLREELLAEGTPNPEDCLPMVAALGARLGLDAAETRMLAVLSVCTLYRPLGSFLMQRPGGGDPLDVRPLLGQLSRLPSGEVARVLSYEGALVQMGLIEEGSETFMRSYPQHRVDERLIDRIQSGCQSPDAYLRCHFESPPDNGLGVDDYAHLGATLEAWLAVLRDGLARGQRGLNVLLHGKPGVGKTQLSQVLAKACGAELVQVAGKGVSGLPVSRMRMLSLVRLADRTQGRERPTLLLVDEADALLPHGDNMEAAVETRSGGTRPASMKAWLVDQLEQNRLPTVWVANDLSDVHPALLRRFQLVMEVKVAPREVRLQIIDNLFGDLPVSAGLRARMAALEDLSPAMVDSLARTAGSLHRAGLPIDDFVVEQLNQSRSLQGLEPLPEPRATPLGGHSLGWLNPSMSLLPLVSTAQRTGALKVCVHGKPGTGKTEFAHMLALMVQRPLMKATAASLLSRWVGGSERLIASTFKRASEQGAVLLIDEVESLLGDRSRLERSHELSQVNTLLSVVDEFKGVLVLTTNHPDRMDPALARRLDYTLEFRVLGRAQLAALWESLGQRFEWGSSGQALSQQVQALEGLAISDIAQAMRRLHVQGHDTPSAFALLGELRQAHSALGVGWRRAV